MMTLLALLALAQVSGYVYAIDGSVVEGITVRTGSSSVTTDKDGRFVLTNLDEGVVELEIGTMRPLVLTGDVVSITLSDAGQRTHSPSGAGTQGDRTVSGKLTLDGKPLANAPVLVGETRVLTNAKGEYAATRLAAARHPVAIDERLSPRLRSPHTGRMYPEGQEPFIADVRKAREASVDLALRSAPMIRGRVGDAAGKPVARARVQLVLGNRSTLGLELEPPPARTTPAGRFAFPAPEWPESEQVTVAVTPLLRSPLRSKPFILGNADRNVDITLPKLETVRIHVLPDGKPVPGARVAFAAADDTGAFESVDFLVDYGMEQLAPLANAEGEVVVELAADTYDFSAAAEGFQTGKVTRTIAKPVTVDLTLERAALLRGRVHRGGRGIAFVDISISGGNMRGAQRVTDPKGTFELEGLSPGKYRLVVSKENELISRTLEVEAPGNVDVELPPAGTLRVRVFDGATGAPVEEFAFYFEPAQTATKGSSQGVAGTDGTFAVELSAGSYRVRAGAANYASSELVEVRIAENATTAVDLALNRGATIGGRVRDESGLPVAGADVMIAAPDLERMRRAAPVGPMQTQTAENGTFTVTGVQPGEAQLTVRRQGYLPHRRTIEAGGTMSVDVTLARGLSIHGIVTHGGKPAAGAQVAASSPAVGGEHQSTVSGEDGRFTLSGLIAARYAVSAILGERRMELRDVDPAEPKEIALSLDETPRGVIYGFVGGMPPATGGKYTRRVVVVYSEAGSAEGMIDDAGNYRIEDAPAGRVSVTAVVETPARTARTSARREVEVTAGQPLRVDLNLAGNVRVSGRVTIDGKPVAGAEIGFSSEEGTTGDARTQEDGSYEVLLAAPGRYQVYARYERFANRSFRTVREIRSGDTVDIDLREEVIEGTVVDAVTRLPVAGALVILAPAAGVMMPILAEVTADAGGRFHLITAATGPLRLTVSAHGYAQRTQPLSGSTTGLSAQYAFELTPAPDLPIRVLDARTGTPLDAQIIFSDAAGILPVRPRRSADGTTYLFSVAPGTYRVLVYVQGYPLKTVDVTAPGAADVVME